MKWTRLAIVLVLGLSTGIVFDRFIISSHSDSNRGDITLRSEPSDTRGVITHRSPWAMGQTLLRLRSAFAAKGLKVFADIDQQAEARAVGSDQPPMHLLVVGNPRAGTPVMVAVPEAGLDLPLKVLVWEAEPGVVRVSLNSADYLAARHGLGAELDQGLRGLEPLIKSALTE